MSNELRNPNDTIDNLAIGKIIEVDGSHIVAELEPKLSELSRAQEVFVTGTAAEITPIGGIAEHHYSVGLITKQLMEDYSAEVLK